jgi:hypothetical protein
MAFLARIGREVVTKYGRQLNGSEVLTAYAPPLDDVALTAEAQADVQQPSETAAGTEVTTRATTTPPKCLEFILRVFVNAEYQSHLAGDLAEEYSTHMVPAFGKVWSDIWYFSQASRTILPIVWKAAYKLILLRWFWHNTGAIFKKLGL